MKVIIIGAGKLGYKLAEAMIKENIDVTIMDSNSKVIERINDHLDLLTVNANGLEVEILKDLDISSYDYLFAVTDSDETNTIICSLAKKLGCIKTIARMRNPEYTEQIDFIKNEMGIDHIVNPDLATANEISRYILKRYNFYAGNFAKGKVQMIDININNIKDIIGKRIMELNNIEGMLIAAISRNGSIIIPNGKTKLMEDDILYIIGQSKVINDLLNKIKLNGIKKNVKRVMIFGGGKIGYYLAKQLSEYHIKSVIIEKDRERCKYLTDKLHSSIIIYGDGTDVNLLEEENIELMDAFVGVSGFDEQNILMCLMAKQYHVNKVISKISRPSYSHVIEKMGIDLALNPVNITLSDILKFIRGGKVVSVSLLLGEEAEVTEVIVDKNLDIVGKEISKLGLPDGMIIGSIVNKGKVLIPNGNTIIQANDRLIIFCLTKNIQTLDMFLVNK